MNKKTRFSAVQKEILRCLTVAVVQGGKYVKSTDVNDIVNARLQRVVHANNFRMSCKTLADNGYIQRHKVELDWFLKVTPKGCDFAFNLFDNGK